MRILHTSDWHAGRIWKGVSRLDELGTILEGLGDFIERERCDLLLVSGDVFDNGAPRPEAERLVFSFFRRVGLAGTRTVVIAGNHDSPQRLEAWGMLAELVHVHAVGRPRRAEEGGLVELGVRTGETARVAAVPFAPVHRLVSAVELAGSETRSRQRYDAAMRAIFAHLSAAFSRDAVNLVMAHTHLQGAVFSGSERQVHLGEQWATTPQALPAAAHYVALGHIHKPQALPAAPAPARYAGSPLQLDFGEEGEEKSFVWIEAAPGRPARVETIPYEGARRLRTVELAAEDLDEAADRLDEDAWLRVRVRLDAPDPDLAARVRRLRPRAVVVEAVLPEVDEAPDPDRPEPGAPPVELYRAYHRKRHGEEPDEALVETFSRLLVEASRAESGEGGS